MAKLFENVRSHLRAGLAESTLRDEAGTSSSGRIDEFITGGGIGLRMKNGSLRTVPKTVKRVEVEYRCFFSLSSLAGEHEDGLWWASEAQLLPEGRQDPDAAEKASIRRSWSRVNKEALEQPIYAPKFPRTAGIP
jgi:hypothetical protein